MAAAAVTGSGRAVLPVALVDEVRGLLAGAAGDAVVAVAGGSVEVTAAGRTVRGPAGDDFPDWRALEPAPGRHRVELTAADLRAAVAAGPAIRQERDGVPYDAVVLTLGTDGELTVAGAGDALEVAVNRDFLLDAVGHTGQLVLELDGPVTPLALRVPGRPDWSLLMPVRLPVAAAPRTALRNHTVRGLARSAAMLPVVRSAAAVSRRAVAATRTGGGNPVTVSSGARPPVAVAACSATDRTR